MHAEEGALQLAEFVLSSDHRRLKAFDAAVLKPKRTRLGALHEVSDDGLAHALDFERWLRCDIEGAAHLAKGVVADA